MVIIGLYEKNGTLRLLLWLRLFLKSDGFRNFDYIYKRSCLDG
jgi:hypothetical protein